MATSIALTGAGQLVRTGPTEYRGFAIRESAGAPAAAVIRIYDGISAAGVLLETISLAASESAREWYGGSQPLLAGNGIYVDIISGTVEGSVRIG